MAGGSVDLPMLSVGPSDVGGGLDAVNIPSLGVDPALDGPMTDQEAVAASAARMGLEPREWAALMHFESGMDPTRWGGKKDANGNPMHVGVIQFGRKEQDDFGVTGRETLQEQLPKAEAFLLSRGYQPGSGLMNAYSTVNAGSPGRFNASDTANGGTWGTVADKVNQQFGPHYTWADKWLGSAGQVPSSTAPTAGIANPLGGPSMGSTAQQGGFGLLGIQAQGNGGVPGQASAMPDVAGLSSQPMTATMPPPRPMAPMAAGRPMTAGYAAPMGASMGSTAQMGRFGLGGIQSLGNQGVPGQASPMPGAASLSAQPMTAMATPASTMMPAAAAQAPAAAQPSLYSGIASALQGITGGQKQQQKAPGMQQPAAHRLSPISLQQARQMFDASRFYNMLRGR